MNITNKKGILGKLFEVESDDEELQITPAMAKAAIEASETLQGKVMVALIP